MQNDGLLGNGAATDFSCPPDLERNSAEGRDLHSATDSATPNSDPTVLAIVVSNGELVNEVAVIPEPVSILPKTGDSTIEVVGDVVVSPKKAHLSRNTSSHEQCRVCQQEKEEDLIDLGCQCRGGLAKAHRSCIDTWFCTRRSTICEICQQVPGFGRLTLPLEGQPLHKNVRGVALVLYGWHSQSSLVVSFWMC